MLTLTKHTGPALQAGRSKVLPLSTLALSLAPTLSLPAAFGRIRRSHPGHDPVRNACSLHRIGCAGRKPSPDDDADADDGEADKQLLPNAHPGLRT